MRLKILRLLVTAGDFYRHRQALAILNIGEPGLTVNNDAGLIKQQVKRIQGLFTRAGTRLAFNIT